MSPPRRDPARSDQILDAAQRAFARLGFDQARMDDVAAESGLSKGALYLSFRSKDQLIDALAGRLASFETRRLREIAAGPGTAAERLSRFAEAYADELVRLGPLAAMFPEVYARALRHATVGQVFRRYLADFQGELARLIRSGIEAGEFRAVDPDAAALAVTGLLEGLALLWTIDREALAIRSVSRSSLELLLDGLRADPAVCGATRSAALGSVRP